MILNGGHGVFLVADAFDRAVIQIDAGDLHIVVSGLIVHREPVVLGSDLHLALAQVHDRLVTAVMAEPEFIGFTAESQI